MIDVYADESGVPGSFTWRGRKHTVAKIIRRWQIDEQWWRERICREYFKLATNNRMLVIVYQDLVSSKWHLQRLFD